MAMNEPKITPDEPSTGTPAPKPKAPVKQSWLDKNGLTVFVVAVIVLGIWMLVS